MKIDTHTNANGIPYYSMDDDSGNRIYSFTRDFEDVWTQEDEDSIHSGSTPSKMSDISSAAAALGRKGGKSKSEAKLAAIRENGKKGGRPRKPVANIYVTRSGYWVADEESGREITTGGMGWEKQKWLLAGVRKLGFRPVRRPDLDRSI